MKKIIIILSIFSVFSSSALVADNGSPVSTSLSVGMYSDYMWRGFNLFEGASLQPSVTVNYDTGAGILSGNLWAHISAEEDSSSAERFLETDETLSYTIDFSPFTLKLGHIWYTYPDSDDDIEDTAEVFGTVVWDDSKFNSIFPLTPSLSLYYDYDVYDAYYYELSLSHAFTAPSLGEGFNFTPFAAIGFGKDSEKVYADDGLVQATYGVSMNMNLGDVSVVPSFNYTQKQDDRTVDEFWFGTSLTYTF